jgi:hypothetical protein
MIKPGSRWKSRVCSAEAVLVRPPSSDGVPQCGGVDMVPSGADAAPAEIVAGHDGGCAVGKRYRSDAAGIELLCTKAGVGSLGFGGEALVPVEAKKLPSSD